MTAKKKSSPDEAEERTESEKRLDDLVEALFQSLPCDNYDQVRQGMNRELGERLSMVEVRRAVSYSRRNWERYGFLVPYIKRGVARKDGTDKGRIFAMLVESDGTFHVDPEHRHHLEAGYLASFKETQTKYSFLAAVMRTHKKYERSPAQQRELARMIRKLDFLHEEIQDLVEDAERKAS